MIDEFFGCPGKWRLRKSIKEEGRVEVFNQFPKSAFVPHRLPVSLGGDDWQSDMMILESVERHDGKEFYRK